MNKQVKITNGEPTDLSRRAFLIGTAAAGVTLGYAAVPGSLGLDKAMAAPAKIDPSVWYSIAPDGLITVTVGKADMGQHIASTMAQMVAEELGSNWKDMRVALTGNDPPTAARVATWIEQAIHIEGRPEWVFVKVHTHGAIEKTASSLLGDGGRVPTSTTPAIARPYFAPYAPG